ncbi:MAG: anti-sigma factor [Burkholderiales bacterium]
MRYGNPQLRDKLASEYVLGTLRGRARARFESLMRYDAPLRDLVTSWENRLTPLARAGGDIAPKPSVWGSLALWRGIAVAGAAFTLILAIVTGMGPDTAPPMAMVAVMNDTQGKPAMTVSWQSMKAVRDPYIRIKVTQKHPTMAPGTAWELWMLPAENQGKPVSLGLITTDIDQVMKLPQELASRIDHAWGIAMSIEPEGGSPTGAPTGPVVMKGPCVKIL